MAQRSETRADVDGTPRPGCYALVIEDDEALGALRIAHGATIRRQLLHFRGAIPASADR